MKLCFFSRAAAKRVWMVVAFALVASTGPGCQFILGIDDVTERSDAGGSSDAATDSMVTPIGCNPVDQSGCMGGQKCARHEVTPGDIRTECVPEGTLGEGSDCALGNPVDDCLGGFTCSRGICTANCDSEHGACGLDDSCKNGEQAFPDRPEFGVCDFRCDLIFQDCPGGEACFASDLVQETQCRPLLNLPVLPGQDAQCETVAGTDECLPNGCEFGFGPHLPPSGPGPLDCAFYCFPQDTHVGNPDSANGGDPIGQGGRCETFFKGSRPDGPGFNFQCRFLQEFVPGLEQFTEDVGVCVDPADPRWQDCTLCDATNQATVAATCGPGCLSTAFLLLVP